MNVATTMIEYERHAIFNCNAYQCLVMELKKRFPWTLSVVRRSLKNESIYDLVSSQHRSQQTHHRRLQISSFGKTYLIVKTESGLKLASVRSLKEDPENDPFRIERVYVASK
jgi:hypothetical protein